MSEYEKRFSTQHRFIEDEKRKALMKKCDDFYRRHHGTPVLRIFLYFIAILAFTLWELNKLVEFLLQIPAGDPPPRELIDSTFAMVIAAAVAAGILAIIILLRVRKNVTETEFQNLIFSSGMVIGSDFCLVVHREQTGFYCDFNFTHLFSDYGEFHHDPFHQLITSEGFSQKDEDKMLAAMEKGESAEFKFILKKKGEKPRNMKILLSPLRRPKGFYLIQGVYV